ncbi:MAG: hypothetical protein WCR86_06670 [Parabacteroides sp.]
MKKYFGICLFILFISACSHQSKRANAERIKDLKYLTITDSVYSTFPSQLYYQNGKLYWEDAFASDYFMHMLDAKTGKELYKFARNGNGPCELNSCHRISLIPQGGLCGLDLAHHAALYKPSGDTLREIPEYIFGGGNWTNCIAIDDTTVVYLYPGKGIPFKFQRNNRHTCFGHLPLNEYLREDERYNQFQGVIHYNSEKKVLVYAPFHIPYLAVYDLSKQKYKLKKEAFEFFKYTVQSNGELHLGEHTPGIQDMNITKDYIITIKHDEKYESTLNIKKDHDLTTYLPYSAFVYDYDLNLVKILNFPFRVLCIGGDLQSNDVYLMALKDDYEIVKISIP